MNCPVCGKEMEPGVLNTLASWDYFLPTDVAHNGRRREAGRDPAPKSIYQPKGCRRLGPPSLGLPFL